MRRLHTFALIAVVAALAGCSGGDADTTTDPTDAAGPEAVLTISDFAFSGPSTVVVGQTVTVTNEDAVGHTWTAVDGEFDSGNLAQGDTFDHVFDEPGEFDYFCSVHPQMTGTITVEG